MATLMLILVSCPALLDSHQGQPAAERDNPDRGPQPPATPADINQPTTGNPQQLAATNQSGRADDLRMFLVERFVDPVTWFTGGLFLLGYLQSRAMRRQSAYMREGLIETRKSADAAKLSADTADKSPAARSPAVA